MSINSAVFTGNLVADGELKATANGFSVLEFSVAVSTRKKDGATGEWHDVPNYLDCRIFGKRAERLAQYMAKGSRVACSAQITQDRWTDKDGRKRSKITFVCGDVDIISAKRREAYQHPEQLPEPAPAPSIYSDSDIPF